MRQAARLRQTMYYALGQTRIAVNDANGDPTGDFTQGYSQPVEFKANISANKSQSNEQPFGMDLNYSKTIYTVEDLPIEEGTRIWKETTPPSGVNDGSTADYYVVRVAKSINNTVYAVRTVSKDGTSTV